jgi:Reverse transcriptase (RNA-dependent DNA polymerase)/Integrase core domain
VGNTAEKWIIDTGASHHFCARKEWYQTYENLVTNISTAGPSIQSEGVGTVRLPVGDHEIALQNVIHVPELRLNILSAERLKKDNFIGYSNWIPHHLFDGTTGRTIVEADASSGLPIISVSQSGELNHFEALDLYYIDAANRQISLDLAHRRLGHISKNLVKKLIKGSTGITLKGMDAHEFADERCDECMAGQMKAKPFPLRQPPLRKGTRPFEMVHMDLLEGPGPALDGHYEYVLVIIDDYTRYSWVYGLRSKHIEKAWAKWQARILRHHGDGDKQKVLIKRIRSDNGGEFISQEMQDQWRSEGIELQLTVAHAHNQVGVAEKAFGDIVSHAVSVLEDARLPLRLWYEITRTLTYLKNLWPHSFLDAKTPFQMIFKKKPDLAHLRVIGSKAWVLIPKKSRGGKFKPRAAVCRLLGYMASNQYKLWDPQLNKIIYARDVVIEEWNTTYEEIQEEMRDNPDHDTLGNLVGKEAGNDSDPETPPQSEIARNPDHIDINKVIDELTGDVEGERDDQLSDDNYEEEEQTSDVNADQTEQGQEQGQPVRPRRVIIPSWKVRENQLDADELPESPTTIDLIMLNLTNATEQLQAPQSLSEILRRRDKDLWLESMYRELRALLRNKTWEYVRRSDVPPGHKILTGRWVWVYKRDGTRKSRWVVRGFEQVEGIDYQETFAAVARAESYRVLLAIATLLDWDIEQLDVDTAFLYGDIDTDIYVEIPAGPFTDDVPDGKIMVCHLLKSLYGLKQAPKIWFDTLRKALEEMGLRRLDTEHSVYVLLQRHGKKPQEVFIGPDLVIAVYVDDIMMIGRHRLIIQEFKSQLSKKFHIKDLGEATDYLGIEIVRDRAAGTLKIHQTKYCRSLLKKYGMDECNPSRIPIHDSTKLTVDDQDKEILDEEGIHRYQSIIGSLTYAMQGTRADLAYAVSLCSRFLAKPTSTHAGIAKGVLRYLKGAIDLGITYYRDNTENLFVYTDSNYQDRTLRGDGRSTSGYGVYLAGGLISWSSRRQHCVTTSSTEAEYIGQANAIKQIITATQFLLELRLPIIHTPIKLYADNTSSQSLAHKPSARPRSGHIDAAMHFQREKVETGLVDITHVTSQDNAADGFTKPLNGVKFARFRELLRMR